MNLSGKRTRCYHKNEFSSDSDQNESINNSAVQIVDKQESKFHPEYKLDLEKEKIFELKSKKGHYTYYTTKIFSKEYFTLKLK